MSVKVAIPNLLTLANLFCGCLGILYAADGQLVMASWMIWTGTFFDFFDGFVARALKVSSELGKQLDSLADMVTFGILPSLMVFQMWQLLSSNTFMPYLALLLALFSALRLAKFNLDSEQEDGFKGLPTPSNALMVSSLPFLVQDSWGEILNHSYFFAFYSIFVGIMLVSNFPLFALKFKNYKFAENWKAYLVLTLGIVAAFVFGGGAFLPVIIFYLLLNLLP